MFNSEGVCSACTAYENRASIDWDLRKSEFEQLCHTIKAKNNQYDVIVPVSGGKDSTYQIIKALEYGLNPLAVTATTDYLSHIGRDNLDNISKLGVDHIEVTTNTKLRRKINAYTLREIGDISWVEHITIFTIPVRIALLYNIPLILWGENPQSEYGGPYKAQEARKLDQRWLQEYGGLNGLRVSDILSRPQLLDWDAGCIERDLLLYTYPKIEKGSQLSGIFLGQFFPWDGLSNAAIAQKNGFQMYYGAVEGVGYPYENLDNYQTGIHDYFKYLKFGFGRCTDLVCNHIRRERITREQGKEMVIAHDGKFPNTYLGKPLEEILEPLDVTIEEFLEICNKFANKELFECHKGKIPRSLFKAFIKDN